eukprot:1655094-Pyramimonas_sp.AAC.1
MTSLARTPLEVEGDRELNWHVGGEQDPVPIAEQPDIHIDLSDGERGVGSISSWENFSRRSTPRPVDY